MQIGIQDTKGSSNDGWSSSNQGWIEYCESKGLKYKLVDCYSSDIMNQLSDCDALMWHFSHLCPKANKFAKQLLFSVEFSGKKVFPDHYTVWHFDDKIGQKYLLEAIGAPLAPAYIFYSKLEALEWASQTDYPKVFKLRNGASSANVRLVQSKSEANRLIRKAFGRGFSQYNAWNSLKDRYRNYRQDQTTLWDVIKGIIRIFYTTKYAKVVGREKGYIYFQDFIPGNDCDVRVVVIEDKAFAFKRIVRENDFRASGSGQFLYEKEHLDEETVQIAFEISENLQVQCMTYDFVYQEGKPLLLEISFGTTYEDMESIAGYWDRDMTWHEKSFNANGWMVDIVINQ